MNTDSSSLAFEVEQEGGGDPGLPKVANEDDRDVGLEGKGGGEALGQSNVSSSKGEFNFEVGGA